MAVLTILLYSTLGTKQLVYEDADGVMTNEIEQTCLRKCSVGSFMAGGARIIVCQKTHEALLMLENKYDSYTKRHIRKLRGFISKLSDGDFFYYFNRDKATIVERRTAIACLNAVKEGMVWSLMLHNHCFHRYTMMNIYFSYYSFGYDGISEFIGEKDEAKRVCRFCGKRKPEVTFDNVAHAIQEALGNKLLVCYEECDTCNHDLALTDDNFRYLMDFRRAMYHIPRKGSSKAPTVVGKTFIIKSNSKGEPELYIMEEALPDEETRQKPFMMHLELKTPINNERMYKALCKMVVDMLPSEELPHFKNTIKWIKSYGYWIPDSLPSALLAVLPTNNRLVQPVLDIFLNNRADRIEAPYCTAIVWLYDIAYMFVVPFVDVDGGQYKHDKELDSHWSFMKKMLDIHTWQKQDTSNYMLSTPWVDWPIDLSSPHIHVLPKSDPVFEKCLEVKQANPDIGMPAFKREGICLDSVVSAIFTPLYHGSLTENNLRDVTQHMEGPVFALNPRDHKVNVSMKVDAYDTTDTIPYFKFSFDLAFRVDTFEDYINIEYDKNGTPDSFALHYELRNYLVVFSLTAAELQMSPQRRGTCFEKCSLDKMLVNDRFLMNAVYIIPYEDDGGYITVHDREIHGVGYVD